ncbi:NACHT domain-containing protein [Rhizobium leguminosarum]|uniref:NACHT domain-containing protein n=1 Tax=Rhizobium leguminosarum TaxID=384 RepID=UPI001C9555FC|nr:hypothetical protein [Rhizobium leguminosarum]MBY5700169.1 hypothetical protein [Rhizobium leguminosarum]
MSPDSLFPTSIEASPPVEIVVAEEKKQQRDDFKAATKTMLAQRVGYLCSNPDCQRPTIGPKMGQPGALSVGVAAHIKAASPGGPRYDEHQTPLERSAYDNGIWLCANDAHIIDHDKQTFTAEVLREWKREAERRAFQQLSCGRGSARVYSPVDDLAGELRELTQLLGLPEETSLLAVREKVKAGALIQIEAFMASPRWPRHPVMLELRVQVGNQVEPLELSRFGSSLMAGQKIILLSGPGTGKTTTLYQAARAMIDSGPIPMFVPLSEWAEGGVDLFGWLVGRHGYEGLSPNHLKFLSHHGDLALLLDGWNEVPVLVRRRLIQELEGLQRDYPLLNLVMTSRRDTLDVPLAGIRVDVLALFQGQQAEIAGATAGETGLKVLDNAWRIPGLRELVSIPLYLRSILEASPTGRLPDTKEEILRSLVGVHEHSPANAELFHRELLGLQDRYLAALATKAQETGRAALKQGDARSVVGAVNRTLVEEGETTSPPSAQHVLGTLVAAHSLVFDSETYAFQHQQILEWFASRDLEDELRKASGKLTFDQPVVSQRLNEAGWGETILFACERMSRADEEAIRIVGEVVELLLKVDPQFAARVIKRSGAKVWSAVGQSVVEFGQTWHACGNVKRARAFMIASGRPEFAEIVWPLVSSLKSQEQMETMRLVPRFNPAVLGGQLSCHYSSLAEHTRDTLAAEMAYHGDSEGLDAALALGLAEISQPVRLRIFEGLSFRGATARMEDLLKGSDEAFANLVAARGHFEGIRNKILLDDLTRRRQLAVNADPSPATRLAKAVATLPDADLPALLESVLKDPTFKFRDGMEQSLVQAATKAPAAVARLLQWRLENGFDLPHRPYSLLEQLPSTDSGAIPELLLNGHADEDVVHYAAFLAGPQTVREFLRRFLAARHDFDAAGVRTEAAYTSVRALENALESTRGSILFEALEGYAAGQTAVEIHDLCNIISAHGRHHDGVAMQLSTEQRQSAVALMNGWGRQLLDQQASRHDLGRLTWAMRKLPDPTQVNIVAEMLNYDLTLLREAHAAFAQNRRNETALQEIRQSHRLDYRVTLTEIATPEAEAVLLAHLSDPEFGTEAAAGLQVIWLQHNEERREASLRSWPDFERAVVNRSRDRSITSDPADAILKVAEAAKAEGTVEGLRRAVKLAGYAVILPHGERSEFFSNLLAAAIDKLELAQRMVVGGLTVPSEIIEGELQRLVKARSERMWSSDDQLREIFCWLKLLAFSDNPRAMLRGYDFVVSDIKIDAWRMRDILPPIRHLPERERVDLLKGLVERIPDLSGLYELYLAMPRAGGLTLDFLEELASGRYGGPSIDRGARHDYPAQIYADLPQIERTALLERYDRATSAKTKLFLASIILAGGDHGSFLKLAADPIGRRAIANDDWSTRQNLLYVHEPIGGSATHFDLIPRDVSRLREGLFELARGDDQETKIFAKRYLDEIDCVLDEEGGIETGPRHPKITAGLPWPEVAMPSNNRAW